MQFAVSSHPHLPPSIRKLAWFRYNLRKFVRFSERAARQCGITPQQHQLILGVAGYTGRGWATISELAEFLQERHNAVASLIDRAASRGLVRRQRSADDRRCVIVTLTPRGEAILSQMAELHRREVDQVQGGEWRNPRLHVTKTALSVKC